MKAVVFNRSCGFNQRSRGCQNLTLEIAVSICDQCLNPIFASIKGELILFSMILSYSWRSNCSLTEGVPIWAMLLVDTSRFLSVHGQQPYNPTLFGVAQSKFLISAPARCVCSRSATIVRMAKSTSSGSVMNVAGDLRLIARPQDFILSSKTMSLICQPSATMMDWPNFQAREKTVLR